MFTRKQAYKMLKNALSDKPPKPHEVWITRLIAVLIVLVLVLKALGVL